MASRSDASATTPVITTGSKGVIQGGGASFPLTQYTKWIDDIHAASPSVGFGSSSATKLNITYNSVGSTTGKNNFFDTAKARKESQMFSGTDSMLSSAQDANRGSANNLDFIMIPMTAGPVSIIVNIPGVTTTLKMNASVLCGIYSGEIKKWNDSKITDLNPTVKALKTLTQNIIPVSRSDGSGTTNIFSQYLATGASAAQSKCGYTSDWSATNLTTSFDGLTGAITPSDTSPATRFAAMRTAKGAVSMETGSQNLGVKTQVMAFPYSIGYVEISFASGTGLRQVALATKSLNTSGSKINQPNYLLASASGASAAMTRHLADNTGTGESPVNPGRTEFVQPVNQSGLTSYPIVGYTWVLVYKKFSSGVADAPTKGQVEGLIYFLNWSLVKGKAATVAGTTTKAYVPLPTSVRAKVIEQLKTITYDGVIVWR
jgi:phosphate transport system substrate-binding protein